MSLWMMISLLLVSETEKQLCSQEPGITASPRQPFQEFKRFKKSVSACYSYLFRQELNGVLN